MSEAAPANPRAYLALAAAAIGFAIGYVVPIYARLPNLFYDPVARHFFLGHRTGPIPMGYVGQVIYGLVGAALAGGATRLLFRTRSDASEGTMMLAAAWTLTGLLLVGAYFTWNNWP